MEAYKNLYCRNRVPSADKLSYQEQEEELETRYHR